VRPLKAAALAGSVKLVDGFGLNPNIVNKKKRKEKKEKKRKRQRQVSLDVVI
jgi:hypothetical protein